MMYAAPKPIGSTYSLFVGGDGDRRDDLAPPQAVESADRLAEWIADVIADYGGVMTSANLGSTLIASDSERYQTIKATFGGLCGLLTRYPHRFVLVNNQPLNHVAVINHDKPRRKVGEAHHHHDAHGRHRPPHHHPNNNNHNHHQGGNNNYYPGHHREGRRGPSRAGPAPHHHHQYGGGAPSFGHTPSYHPGVPGSSSRGSFSSVSGASSRGSVTSMGVAPPAPMMLAAAHHPQHRGSGSSYASYELAEQKIPSVLGGHRCASSSVSVSAEDPHASIGGGLMGGGAGMMMMMAPPMLLSLQEEEQLRQQRAEDEGTVLFHCCAILALASDNSLKAVDLANALRSRVGVDMLARIRESHGGLLALLEHHRDVVRVRRVPKHDLVSLVVRADGSYGPHRRHQQHQQQPSDEMNPTGASWWPQQQQAGDAAAAATTTTTTLTTWTSPPPAANPGSSNIIGPNEAASRSDSPDPFFVGCASAAAVAPARPSSAPPPGSQDGPGAGGSYASSLAYPPGTNVPDREIQPSPLPPRNQVVSSFGGPARSSHFMAAVGASPAGADYGGGGGPSSIIGGAQVYGHYRQITPPLARPPPHPNTPVAQQQRQRQRHPATINEQGPACFSGKGGDDDDDTATDDSGSAASSTTTGGSDDGEPSILGAPAAHGQDRCQYRQITPPPPYGSNGFLPRRPPLPPYQAVDNGTNGVIGDAALVASSSVRTDEGLSSLAPQPLIKQAAPFPNFGYIAPAPGPQPPGLRWGTPADMWDARPAWDAGSMWTPGLPADATQQAPPHYQPAGLGGLQQLVADGPSSDGSPPSRRALERLMSDDYVPTQRWPMDDGDDAPIIRTVTEQLRHLHGCATLNKLRSALRQRHHLSRSVKSVPLRGFITAYNDCFALDGSHVYLRNTYALCGDLASL